MADMQGISPCGDAFVGADFKDYEYFSLAAQDLDEEEDREQ